MGKIKILEDTLIDKIAAGEIVERPASVVKELVENALDAGASAIEIAISKGGKERIEVNDDGEGMDREDLILAFERHATSKIAHEKQLFSIATMGFRGEALPSIASVSLMSVRSGTGYAVPGHEVHVRGGKISAVEEVSPLKGTSTEVRSLFFNTPARKKFLKSDVTELSHITETIQNFALSFYDLRFTLRTGKKVLLDLLPGSGRLERISQIFSPGLSRNLLSFEQRSVAVQVRGFISKITETRSSRSGQFFFVNGRFIKDRLLMSSTFQAYKSYFPGSHPYLFLFLDVDPLLVDVNVHPAKMEIRFQHPQEIFRTVQEAVRTALDAARSFHSTAMISPPAIKTPGIPSLTYPEPPVGQRSLDKLSGTDVKERVSCEDRTKEVKIMGQHRNMFIIASKAEDLFIVDQHIAHERVLFEELMSQYRQGSLERQKLLFPITLELSPAESSWVRVNEGLLAAAGFSLESFGPGGFKVEETPASLLLDSVPGFIREMATASPHESRALEEKMDHVISTLACHSAVKAGERLGAARMEYILESLWKCSNPYFCPHGRPIILKIEIQDLLKQFKRKE